MIEILRNNIKLLLDKKKLKASHVEKMAGVTRGLLAGFLNKKTNYPKFETIFLIARYLRQSLDDLCGLNFQRKDYLLSDVPWNSMIFEKIIQCTNEHIIQKKINISGQRVLDITKDIYISYCKEHFVLDKEIDIVFIKWIVSNTNFS